MKNLTNEELGNKIKKLRMSLKGIINSETESLLIEIEQRLTGNAINLPIATYKKPGKPRKPTKAELRAKFNM